MSKAAMWAAVLWSGLSVASDLRGALAEFRARTPTHESH